MFILYLLLMYMLGMGFLLIIDKVFRKKTDYMLNSVITLFILAISVHQF